MCGDFNLYFTDYKQYKNTDSPGSNTLLYYKFTINDSHFLEFTFLVSFPGNFINKGTGEIEDVLFTLIF